MGGALGDRRTGALAGAALVAAIVALVLVVRGGDGGGHRLSLVVPDANFMRSGLNVRAAGVRVGQVVDAEVTDDNRARLDLRIDDDAVWPLRYGTRARLRWGGTAKFSDRYVELVPAARGRALPDGAVLQAVDTTTPDDFVTSPTEFDELFRIFDRSSRKDLKALLDNGGRSLDRAAPQFQRALDRAPQALEQAAGALGDLSAEPRALDALVLSSDRVVHAIRTSTPDVGQLIDGAATTFDAVGDESRSLSLALEKLPRTLVVARRTLSHADRTLVSAEELARRVNPGVTQVRKIARPLTSVLSTVVDVGPDVRRTLSTLRRAIPDLDPFVDRARSQMPTIESIGRRADHLLECVRPYVPELMGFFQNWSSGFSRAPAGGDHFINAAVGTFPWPNGDPRTTAELQKLFPWVKSPFYTPPGMIGGQPWWQPQCGGIVPEIALDPTKDADNRPLVGAKLASLGGRPKTRAGRP